MQKWRDYCHEIQLVLVNCLPFETKTIAIVKCSQSSLVGFSMHSNDFESLDVTELLNSLMHMTVGGEKENFCSSEMQLMWYDYFYQTKRCRLTSFYFGSCLFSFWKHSRKYQLNLTAVIMSFLQMLVRSGHTHNHYQTANAKDIHAHHPNHYKWLLELVQMTVIRTLFIVMTILAFTSNEFFVFSFFSSLKQS